MLEDRFPPGREANLREHGNAVTESFVIDVCMVPLDIAGVFQGADTA